MHLNLTNLPTPQVYAMMTQSVIPRPVAWVLSENVDASYNLAPFSYFNAVASDPATVMLSIGRKPSGAEQGKDKDTRVNIRERKHFVAHIAHRALAEELNATAATLDAGKSELDIVEQTLTEMPGSPLPRLAQCRLAFACVLSDSKVIGRQEIIFATVTDLYIDDSAVGEDEKGRARILAEQVDPIARLGGSDYMTFGDILTLDRPD